MPQGSSGVLKHAISILDCFKIEQSELGVRETARLTGLSASTAGRLMAEMKEIGLLRQNPNTRLYSLGSKVLSWSGVFMATLDLRSISLPHMETLRKITGETVTLYIVEGKYRICVERMESQQNIRMVSRVGQRLPLYAGSAGKAILAFLPIEQSENILRTTELKPLTPHTIVDREILRKELKKIREMGYAVSHGEWLLEASGIAAPILGSNGNVLGAITISGPSPRFTSERIQEYASIILDSAQKISSMMGYSLKSKNSREGEKK